MRMQYKIKYRVIAMGGQLGVSNFPTKIQKIHKKNNLLKLKEILKCQKVVRSYLVIITKLSPVILLIPAL